MKKAKIAIIASLIFNLIGNAGFVLAEDGAPRTYGNGVPPPAATTPDQLEKAQETLEGLMNFKNQIQMDQFQTNLDNAGVVTEFQSTDPLIKNFSFVTGDGMQLLLQFSFEEKNNEISLKQITVYDDTFDWEIILKIVDGVVEIPAKQDPGDDISSGDDDPYKVSLSSGFDMASDSMIKSLLPNVGEIKMGTPGMSMPALPESKPRLTITIEQTPKQAQSFLSTLNLSSKLSEESKSGKAASFSELRQVIHHFEKSQEIAFRDYIRDSHEYYAQLKKTLESTGFEKEMKGMDKIDDIETRKQIDRKVEQILRNDQLGTPQARMILAIRDTQKTLFAQYLEPSQNRLKETLEANLGNFHEHIAQLFDGGKTTVQSKGGVTEILLYLVS
jgi:hypothetical protein